MASIVVKKLAIEIANAVSEYWDFGNDTAEYNEMVKDCKKIALGIIKKNESKGIYYRCAAAPKKGSRREPDVGELLRLAKREAKKLSKQV